MAPLDILSAASHPDPYPWYRHLQSGADPLWDPVHRLWVVTRGATLVQALEHPALRVRPPNEPVPAPIAGTPAGELFQHLVRMNDGPQRHAAPKHALQWVLAGTDLADVAARTTRVAAACAGVDDWLFEVPVRSVADLLGFAPSDHATVARWVRDFVAAIAPAAADTDRQRGSAAARALMDRFEAMVQHAPPRDGSVLARAVAEPWPDAKVLWANLAGLLSQTFEATAALMGNTVVALARGADPTGLPKVVDTVMRLDAPIQNTRRFAAEALRLGNSDLPQGAALLLVLGAAGHDPAFDAVRRPLGFGWGPHACPGAAIARTVVVAALRERLRHPGWALPADWTYRPSVNARIPVFPAR